LGLLRGESATTEPDGQVLRMEADAEFLADHVGEPRPGPQIGREPVLGWLVGQPSANDLFLRGGQLGRPARGGTGHQTGDAPCAEGGKPTRNGRTMDAEEVGDLRDGISLADSLQGEMPSAFEFVE
jgi:hypothetical protein